MALRPRLFDPGQTQASFNVFAHLEASASTVLRTLPRDSGVVMTLNQPESSTLGFLQVNNAATCNDKSTSSNKRTLSTISSLMSPPASTSRGPACVPFWTASTGVLSRKLWSCTATGVRDSQLTYWSSTSAKKAYNSWYTVAAKTPVNLPDSFSMQRRTSFFAT